MEGFSLSSTGERGQYHLRERVGPLINYAIDFLTHPLTQVVLTSCSDGLRQIQSPSN